MDVQSAKLGLMAEGVVAGAILTGATIVANGGKMPDGKPVLLQLADPGTQEALLAIYELAKSEFWGLEKALQDASGVWPDPVVTAAAQANPVAALNGVLKLANVPASVTSLVQQALALLSGSVTPATPIPAPGSDVAAPSTTTVAGS